MAYMARQLAMCFLPVQVILKVKLLWGIDVILRSFGRIRRIVGNQWQSPASRVSASFWLPNHLHVSVELRLVARTFTLRIQDARMSFIISASSRCRGCVCFERTIKLGWVYVHLLSGNFFFSITSVFAMQHWKTMTSLYFYDLMLFCQLQCTAEAIRLQ